MAHAKTSTYGIIRLKYHIFAILNRLMNLGNIVKQEIITHYAPPNDKTHNYLWSSLAKKSESIDNCRKHRRQRNMLNYTMGPQWEKPRSWEVLQDKQFIFFNKEIARKKVRVEIHIHLQRFNSHINPYQYYTWTLFGSCFKQTINRNNNIYKTVENLNMDWIFHIIKVLL